jgi:hypothetical protein
LKPHFSLLKIAVDKRIQAAKIIIPYSICNMLHRAGKPNHPSINIRALLFINTTNKECIGLNNPGVKQHKCTICGLGALAYPNNAGNNTKLGAGNVLKPKSKQLGVSNWPSEYTSDNE